MPSRTAPISYRCGPRAAVRRRDHEVRCQPSLPSLHLGAEHTVGVPGPDGACQELRRGPVRHDVDQLAQGMKHQWRGEDRHDRLASTSALLNRLPPRIAVIEKLTDTGKNLLSLVESHEARLLGVRRGWREPASIPLFTVATTSSSPRPTALPMFRRA